MKRRANAELEAMLAEDLAQLTNYAQTNLISDRRKAWDMYLCRDRGDEIEGRSSIKDTSLRDHHQAIMATIMPSFATDYIAALEPAGPDDEDQADAESMAVNKVFTEDNSGFHELSNAISDALLFSNGIVKVWIDISEESETLRFNPNVDAGAAAVALEEQGYSRIKTKVSEDALEVTGTKDVERLMVKAIEPSYFFADPNSSDQDLSKHIRLAERVIMTRSELVALGVPKAKVKLLDEITDYGVSTSAGNASDTDTQAKFVDRQASYVSSKTWDEQLIDCYWLYRLVDSERHRFLMSSDKMLLNDPVNFWPYASGSAFPVPHRWQGQSLYHLLEQTVHNRTNMLRQLNDNLNFSNNQRPVYNPTETRPEDIANGAPGRGIRSKNPANVGWMPFTDITSNSLAALAYMDDIAGRQAGAALDLAAPDRQAISDVSGISAELQLGPKEMIVSQIARNLSETLVRQTFLLIHRVLREQFNGTIMYRKTDQWTEADPSEWPARNRINITVGLSPGDRRRQGAALSQVMQMQLALIQGGAANIAVTYKGYHAAVSDWLKSVSLDGAEGYFLDPAGEESQAGQQAAAQAQQAEQQTNQQLQQIMVQLEQQGQQLEKYKQDSDLQFKYTELALKGEIEEAKLVADGINANLSNPQVPAVAGANGGTASGGPNQG